MLWLVCFGMLALRSLAAVDLNALVHLQALLEEGSVTRAAGRVGITQPAMSRSLARLRVEFDDPLLVREGRGMALSPYARELAPALGAALASLAGILVPRVPFDGSEAVTLRVAMNDYAGLVLLPRLLARLAKLAPAVSLDIRPFPSWAEVGAELARGVLDAAVGFDYELPEALTHSELFRDEFVVIARRRHPRLREGLDARAYVELAHVLVSTRGRVVGSVDLALAQRGLERRVAVTVPHFLVAPEAVRSSDHIATVARRIIELAPRGLAQYEPPLPVAGFGVVLAWHPSQEATRVHGWLRAQVEACAPTTDC